MRFRSTQVLGAALTIAGVSAAAFAASGVLAQRSDEPMATPAKPQGEPPFELLSEAEVDEIARIVSTSLDLPPGAQVLRVEPGFDDAGELSGGVAVVHFEPYTGRLSWPSDQLYAPARPDGGPDLSAEAARRWLTDIYEYQVVELRRALVAVDLESGRVQWAAPDPGAEIDELAEPELDEVAAARSAGRVVSSRLSRTVGRDTGQPVDPTALQLVQVRPEPGQ